MRNLIQPTAEPSNVHEAQITSHADVLREALRQFVGCSYPVATELNPKGYDWCIAWLDEALANARSALAATEPAPMEDV